MNAYYQKHRLKIFLAVFCFALVLPLVSLIKTVSADCMTECTKSYSQCALDCGYTPGADLNNSSGGIEIKKSPETEITKPTWIEDYLIIPLLKIVLKLATVLLSVAETIFEWIVNPATMKAIMTNSAVYTTWRAVRDVFNVVFIMVLLFSAFATVFQYSKFNYKNVLLNLVLMALLVNFSYPIARFIIDLSNIIMFGFLQSMGGDNSFMAIIQKSGLKDIITVANPDAFFLLAAAIFTFIFAITLLVIAVLLVIRTVSLTLYIIFSPLAFVGSVLPGTKLANAGNEWWTDFMKNCFAGPIIVFMLYIANVLMSAMASSGGQISHIAESQVGGLGDPASIKSIIMGISTFALPVIVLWMGIIQAQKSGIAGAEKVVGYGKKAMGKLSGYNWGKKQYADFSKVRDARKEEARWKPGKKIGEKFNQWQDTAYGKARFLPGSAAAQERAAKARQAQEREFERDVNKYGDEIKNDTSTSLHTELDKLLSKANKTDKDKIAITAIMDKLRKDDDLNTANLTAFNASGGDLVSEIEKAGGKKMGNVYANKLIKHSPDLAFTSARALEIAREESGNAAMTRVEAVGHFTSKIKGANGAKNLAPGSIGAINGLGAPAQEAFIENLDHSVVGELVRTNRLSDVSDLSNTINNYMASDPLTATMSNAQKISWLKNTARPPKIQNLGKLIDADAKLRSLLGLA